PHDGRVPPAPPPVLEARPGRAGGRGLARAPRPGAAHLEQGAPRAAGRRQAHAALRQRAEHRLRRGLPRLPAGGAVSRPRGRGYFFFPFFFAPAPPLLPPV